MLTHIVCLVYTYYMHTIANCPTRTYNYGVGGRSGAPNVHTHLEGTRTQNHKRGHENTHTQEQEPSGTGT